MNSVTLNSIVIQASKSTVQTTSSFFIHKQQYHKKLMIEDKDQIEISVNAES